MTSSPPSPPTRPSRLEVVLSGVVWPGVGQLVQRRYPAGACFIIAGLICAGFILAESVYPACVNLLIVLEMYGYTLNDPLIQPSIPTILISIAALLLIYLVSLTDAYIHYRRRLREWQRIQREPAG